MVTSHKIYIEFEVPKGGKNILKVTSLVKRWTITTLK